MTVADLRDALRDLDGALQVVVVTENHTESAASIEADTEAPVLYINGDGENLAW